MRILKELLTLTEGVTFGVAELKKDERYPKGYFTGERWWREEEDECWVCDGKGHEEHEGKKYECRYCKGKKTYTKHVSDSPELDVSNTNARAILDFLGIADTDEGTVGHLEPHELPAVRRKLIKLLNKPDDLTAPGEDDPGEMRRYKGDDGMDRIGRGVRVITGSRDAEQVTRYAEQLLKIIDFAQKNDAYVSWA